MAQNNITPAGITISGTALNIKTWQPAAATSGDDTTVAIALYYASAFVPGECLVTGIGYLVGSAGGTGKVIVSLHDIGGKVLAQSAVAGTVIGTAAQTQEVSFTTPLTIKGPAIHLLAVTFNEAATRKFRTIPAYTDMGCMAGTATQTFVAVTDFVPSTTRFTVAQGPICYLF